MDLIELIEKARNEAILRGIKANTIIIDEHLRYIKPFCLGEYPPSYFGMFPPMIMGMEIQIEPLPEGIDFVICQKARTEREKIISSVQIQAIKGFADKVDYLCEANKSKYSHLCKSKREANDETCRYQAVLALQAEIKELLKDFLKDER